MTIPLAEFEVDRPASGTVVVTVRGEIDLSNVELLEREVRAAIDDQPDVLVDLTSVTYLDSQGLRLLYSLHDEVSRRGGTLTVVAPDDGVAGRLLTLVRADDVLTVRASR